MPPTDKSQPPGRQTWKAPDLARCRAMRFGLGDDIVYCLLDDAKSCGYSLRFGSSFLCLHPKRGDIVSLTDRAPH